MAVTLIRKNINGDYANVMFKSESTVVEEKELRVVKVMLVDQNLRCLSQPLLYELDLLTEEEYHKTLRKNAAVAGHLITSHCTNPEWNPKDYTKNLEDCINEGH